VKIFLLERTFYPELYFSWEIFSPIGPPGKLPNSKFNFQKLFTNFHPYFVSPG
jgi:hypothetical protein